MTERYRIRNSIQAGLEYDSNVYKTFNVFNGDWLTRILLKSSGEIPYGENFSIGWIYQGGGKVFAEQSAQNTLIQYLEAPIRWRLHPNFAISFVPDFKYQNENSSLDDTLPTPLDVNEDYWSTTSRLTGQLFLPASFTLEPFGEFTYFNFGAIPDFSFLGEMGGATLRHQLARSWVCGVEYIYSAQQFQESTRADKENSIGGFFQYVGTPFFSTRYVYEKNHSNQGIYSFSNHRVNVLLSFPFGVKKEREITEDGEPAAFFAFHLLGTLQYKRYPETFDYTQEGERYLLTGAEDDNFNSIVAKLTAHPWKTVTMEAKYTRYSNEFSEAQQNQKNEFRRSLYYAGLRVAF